MTFANLPSSISNAIVTLLQQQEDTEWVQRAQGLHDRYVGGQTNNKAFVQDFEDALAYLALRSPATYAQIFGALEAIRDIIPSWKPKTLLDIGCGPGTAAWATTTIWPDIAEIVALDQSSHFLSLGKQIAKTAQLPQQIRWSNHDIRERIDTKEAAYDLVIIANVLNELHPKMREKIIGQAWNSCTGVLLIIEPGTPAGSDIVSSAAYSLSKAGNLLAPYIDNSFVKNDEYYLHFPQRFIRPEFQRRVRQHMRDDGAKASDWEEAKYAYVALSKMPAEKKIWGRCVGPIEMQKGFLEAPILTKEAITKIKAMKRHKASYANAKHLTWGATLTSSPEAL